MPPVVESTANFRLLMTVFCLTSKKFRYLFESLGPGYSITSMSQGQGHYDMKFADALALVKQTLGDHFFVFPIIPLLKTSLGSPTCRISSLSKAAVSFCN